MQMFHNILINKNQRNYQIKLKNMKSKENRKENLKQRTQLIKK